MRTFALLLALPSAAAISCYTGGGYAYTGRSCWGASESDTNTASTWDCVQSQFPGNPGTYDYCGLLDIDISKSGCSANYQFGFCGSDTISSHISSMTCSEFTADYTDDAIDSVTCTTCTTDNCNVVDPDASGLSAAGSSKPVIATAAVTLLAAALKLA